MQNANKKGLLLGMLLRGILRLGHWGRPQDENFFRKFSN